MKRKILKDEVYDVIFVITLILSICICSIDDFGTKDIPIILAMMVIVIFNIWVLTKYGSDV